MLNNMRSRLLILSFLSIAPHSLGAEIPLVSLSQPATITAAPDVKYAKALFPRQGGQYACSWVSTVIEQCSDSGYNKAGGISGLPYCACYPDQQYNPNEVDGYIQQCYNFAGTNANFASGLAPYLGLCRSAGDVRGSISSGYTACSYASSIQAYCSDLGYGQVSGPSKLAVCACYSTSVWKPNQLDDLWSSCFDYAQVADTSLATAVWPLITYCSTEGDVRQLMTEGSSICNSFLTVVNSCSRYNQFRTGDRIEQASYFCYDSNTNYIGASRDKSAQECYSFATEYYYNIVNSVSSLQGLCSRAGDVRALYPDDDGSGSNSGGNSGGNSNDDSVPSPGSTSRAPTSTSTSDNSEDAAPKFEISLILISFLCTLCVTMTEII